VVKISANMRAAARERELLAELEAIQRLGELALHSTSPSAGSTDARSPPPCQLIDLSVSAA
jgi:hypothetical protein